MWIVFIEFFVIVVQSLSCVWLFVIPWTAAHQASLSFTTSRSLLKFMSIESVLPVNFLSSVTPFSSCLQSFPASESFPLSQLFTSGGQSIGASASASANIQGWFPHSIIKLPEIKWIILCAWRLFHPHLGKEPQIFIGFSKWLRFVVWSLSCVQLFCDPMDCTRQTQR